MDFALKVSNVPLKKSLEKFTFGHYHYLTPKNRESPRREGEG